MATEPARQGQQAARRTGGKERPGAYHHGSLRDALLDAAERILEQVGIQALTLRAAARGAGVSHAAPKNHFGDLSGLLSDLAARGFERLAAVMQAELGATGAADERLTAIGRGYVAFARGHPGMFLLMFRSERLDMQRPALRDAVQTSTRVLTDAVSARHGGHVEHSLSLPQAAQMVAAWSLVHGFAMLLLDGRLASIVARLPTGATAEMLLQTMLSTPRPKQ